MKTRIIISILWLVFAILFFCLAWCHCAKSKQIIPEFDITSVLGDGADFTYRGISIEKPFQDFANDFNKKYLANQNESNRKANLLACYGYLLAGLTALVSMWLVWQEKIFALLSKSLLVAKRQKMSKNNK
jgi:hypothetical protein